LLHGTEQVLPLEELKKKLKKKKKLRIKLGLDPTAPDIHLGHTIVLQKLKDFQDQGHEIIFLIGDFTAQIGDPSGKSKTRPPLSSDEIKKNAETYLDQVSKVLDKNKITVRYNSEWLSKMSFEDVVKLTGKVTLARIIERDDFAKRFKEKVSIGLHELLYPLMQGYDSVELESDVELGGTDQTFNVLMGRFLQQQFDQEPQIVMTLPLLEGLDGVQKMSKSLGNYVGLAEDGATAYGKLMSISDVLMWKYFELVLRFDKKEIVCMQKDAKSGDVNPMNIKKEMAYKIIERFWSKKDADDAQSKFESLFQKKDYSQAQEVKVDLKCPVWIVELLRACGAIKSSSEGRRLIESGAVSLDGKAVKDFKAEVTWKSGMTLKVGKKRIYKLK
jgi:tyrosyl-tRNA synthetase